VSVGLTLELNGGEAVRLERVVRTQCLEYVDIVEDDCEAVGMLEKLELGSEVRPLTIERKIMILSVAGAIG